MGIFAEIELNHSEWSLSDGCGVKMRSRYYMRLRVVRAIPAYGAISRGSGPMKDLICLCKIDIINCERTVGGKLLFLRRTSGFAPAPRKMEEKTLTEKRCRIVVSCSWGNVITVMYRVYLTAMLRYVPYCR